MTADEDVAEPSTLESRDAAARSDIYEVVGRFGLASGQADNAAHRGAEIQPLRVHPGFRASVERIVHREFSADIDVANVRPPNRGQWISDNSEAGVGKNELSVCS